MNVHMYKHIHFLRGGTPPDGRRSADRAQPFREVAPSREARIVVIVIVCSNSSNSNSNTNTDNNNNNNSNSNSKDNSNNHNMNLGGNEVERVSHEARIGWHYAQSPY